ncbi:pyridoxal phosphate-dependent aminotransferase [Pseudemcibacter aquimaris]|uniref:pyridoxal phosphate-dependent aminotransferase n=1 Tax=Pseudemcibacter aquimaris TaxID=2857064 RepID=UPI00201174B9|nr:pyridoxal phosphate-dependent aminotransferase [Pseudemcibacter aquimaris]MCC3862427.1 pyridoxal phosphate-dependent aminotransferase [Pseudemcibacter aquimaris]WDU59143.1 pyridoxal phosphate-dependent aminotransferase [Pseudemcibacter aquimaris]
MTKEFKAIDGLESKGLRLNGSATRELANATMGRDNIIPLWFGEPDVSTPDFICKAAAGSLEHGETFYSEGLGKPFLREAIAKYQSGLFKNTIGTDRIAVTLSGGNALNLAFQLILNDGDKVVTTIPAFPNLLAIPSLQSAAVEAVHLEYGENGWKLDIDKFLAAARGAKVVLLNSPGNPTGWTLSREEQQTILQEFRKTGTWLISDEVYNRIYYNGLAAPSFLEIAEPEDRVIAVNSFSKTWAMTGWRIGWLTLPPSLIPTVEKLMEYSVACAPVFIQRAAKVALEQGEDFIKTSKNRYNAGLDVVEDRLSRHQNISFKRPEAAFYAYFQIDGVKNNMEMARYIIDETGVGLAPGVAFDPSAKDWFRLCFAQSEERLHQAFDRLDPFIRKIVDK